MDIVTSALVLLCKTRCMFYITVKTCLCALPGEQQLNCFISGIIWLAMTSHKPISLTTRLVVNPTMQAC